MSHVQSQGLEYGPLNFESGTLNQIRTGPRRHGSFSLLEREISVVNLARRMTGVIFSDLGQAASFMALDWVKAALTESLKFAPFPATLNVRPKSPEDMLLWEAVQREFEGIAVAPSSADFCSARLYRVEVCGSGEGLAGSLRAAVLLPKVPGYPKDKIEIVAPVRIKDALGVNDGDYLTLEFHA